MNDLVINYNGTPATTQDKVSVLTDNNEQSVQRLIRTYEADLREFGELNFHNIQVKAGLGLTYRKVYCLNEQQATLLLTYMKNTAKVREAKKILVKAFYDMRQKLQECQINGYKSQISQHNAVILDLRNQLKAYEFNAVPVSEVERLKEKLKNTEIRAKEYKLDMEYFAQKYRDLKAEIKMNPKGTNIAKALAHVQTRLDGVYEILGWVGAYAVEDNKYYAQKIERIGSA